MRIKLLKKRKIRRSSGKNRKLYFDANTQASIVEYQKTESLAEKEIIYRDRIFPAFDKLVENLILIYGFAKGGEIFLVLKNDCVTFLYETLYKFDESKGTKAFSYFNVVAKNWLILNYRRKKRRTDKHVSLADQTKLSIMDRTAIANHQVCPSPDDQMIEKEFRAEIMQTLEKIRSKVDGKNDVACIAAVITVFENVDQLDFLNKRAIFVYVRDISGLNSKQLSASMSSIRKLYREIKATNKDLF
ncbi:hypothetical protein CL634_08145 [bacterium]|nr:hypothetical protein [bacterium]